MKKYLENKALRSFHQELGKREFLKEFSVQKGTKIGNLDITIRRFFTNIDGTIVAKGTVPIGLQVKYPYYLFGKFDFDGGFFYGNEVLPPQGSAKYMYSFIYGSEFQFNVSFSGFNDINNQLRPGDLVSVYTDDLSAPNFFVFMVVSIPNQSYGSVLGNSSAGKYVVRNIKYQVSNGQETQFNEPIVATFVNPLANPKNNQIQPNTYRTPYQFQAGNVPDAQANIKATVQISQYIGLYSYMTFANDLVNYQFDTAFKLLYIEHSPNINGK